MKSYIRFSVNEGGRDAHFTSCLFGAFWSSCRAGRSVRRPGSADGGGCHTCWRDTRWIPLTPVTYQLGWLPNVENGGEFYAAARGFFAKEGIAITLLPGGPTTTVEPEIVSGKCLVGLSETDTTARANLQGAKIKTIAATLQETPLAVASLASKPILTPKDLYGKRLGVQSFQESVFMSFFKMIGVDSSRIKFIPAQGDPSILVAGEVDALSVFVTNEPITLALQGIKTHVWTLGQYGWSVFGDTIEASEAALSNSTTRDIIVRTVRGAIRGWQGAGKPGGNRQHGGQ